MHWIFGVKFVNLGDSCTVGGDRAMNIIIARVPGLNVSEIMLSFTKKEAKSTVNISINKRTHQFEASLTLPSYVHTKDLIYNVRLRCQRLF